MKVNGSIEEAVREAFASCVAEEPARFGDAQLAILDRGEEFLSAAISLAVAIDVAALLALSENVGPDEEQARQLARECAESETWSGAGISIIEPLMLDLAATGRPRAPIGQVNEAQAVFVIGAWLLSDFLPEDRHWTDMLDDLLVQLEATPGLRSAPYMDA